MIRPSEEILERAEEFAANHLKGDARWKVLTTETLLEQQEFYLESLHNFEDFTEEEMGEVLLNLFFNTLVYLSITRTLLERKRLGIPPQPLKLI